VSDALIEALQARYDGLTIEAVDLYHYDLPAIAGDNIEAKYTLMLGRPISSEHAQSWADIERAIQHFLSADVYVISTPMWNFSIPYALKYYIDCIVQSGYLFRYNEIGQALPLVHGRRMVCVTSRGGDYSADGPMHVYDFQEPYLRAIFGFIGITDLEFINSQPMDITPELREMAVAAAIERAREIASRPDWPAAAPPAEWAAQTPDGSDANPLGLKPRPLEAAAD
jgi:FMN-dependent NADH-azoreductase